MKPQKGMLDKNYKDCLKENKINNKFNNLCRLFGVDRVKLERYIK